MSTERKTLSAKMTRIPGRYPKRAYDFILEGLNSAVEQVHGPLTPAQAIVAQYMAHEGIDLEEILDRCDEGSLAPDVSRAICEAGGIEQLNRHVGGADLCWALRDCALDRWGMLAEVVLRSWGLKCTLDMGELVFDLIENGRLQREPQDRIEDFRNVYDFKEALRDAYQIDLRD